MGKKKKNKSNNGEIRELPYEIYQRYCASNPRFELICVFKDRIGRKFARFFLRGE